MGLSIISSAKQNAPFYNARMPISQAKSAHFARQKCLFRKTVAMWGADSKQ